MKDGGVRMGVVVGVGGVACGAIWFSTGAWVERAAGLSEKVPVGRQAAITAIPRLTRNSAAMGWKVLILFNETAPMFHLF